MGKMRIAEKEEEGRAEGEKGRERHRTRERPEKISGWARSISKQ